MILQWPMKKSHFNLKSLKSRKSLLCNVTYHNEVPHARRLADKGGNNATSGPQQHEFGGLVVEQLVHDVHPETRHALQRERQEDIVNVNK